MSGDFDNKPRTVKLRCPSLSKIVSFTAWDDHKLDLGSISTAFGLDPSTLKLNGHFISRGLDLVSSSVTWRSLLNFFSYKGLSTGKHDMDALIVDGKLSKSGTKRSYNPQEESNDISRIHNNTTEAEEVGISRGLQKYDTINFLINKKLKENHSGSGCVSKCSKRKQLLEDVNLLKKLKINDANSVGERRRGDLRCYLQKNQMNFLC